MGLFRPPGQQSYLHHVQATITTLDKLSQSHLLPESRALAAELEGFIVEGQAPSVDGLRARLTPAVSRGDLEPDGAFELIQQAKTEALSAADARERNRLAVVKLRPLLWKTFCREVEESFAELQALFGAKLERFTKAIAMLPPNVTDDSTALNRGAAKPWLTARRALNAMLELQKLCDELRTLKALSALELNGGFAPREFHWRQPERLVEYLPRYRRDPILAMREAIERGAEPSLLSAGELREIVEAEQPGATKKAARSATFA